MRCKNDSLFQRKPTTTIPPLSAPHSCLGKTDSFLVAIWRCRFSHGKSDIFGTQWPHGRLASPSIIFNRFKLFNNHLHFGAKAFLRHGRLHPTIRNNHTSCASLHDPITMTAHPPPSYEWTLHPGRTDYGAVHTHFGLYKYGDGSAGAGGKGTPAAAHRDGSTNRTAAGHTTVTAQATPAEHIGTAASHTVRRQ